MSLTGFWQPAQSSARFEAELTLGSSEDFHLAYDDQTVTGRSASLTFSDRVGNIPRKITLPDGSLFQTTENDAVDDWLKQSQHDGAKNSWMHSMENSLRWIGLAFIGTLLFGFVMIKYGLPWASHKIAHRLPPEANISLSSGTLKTMDEYILKPSDLAADKKAEIKARFNELLKRVNTEGFEYSLQFRKMNGIANAFALPSGTVVVTDRLVEVLKNPKELEAVLLHEIGHVVHRHSMQQVIQSSALTVAVVMWTGDTTAVDGWVTALPTFLLQNKYSQDFETESDVFAFEHMIELGIDPVHFGNGLKRITSDAYKDDPEMKENMEKAEKILEYLSSHP